MNPAAAPRPRIACVDDEPAQLAAVQRILAGESMDAVTFQDPVIALSEILKSDYSIVVTDNKMPGMSGMELLTTLKASAVPARRILLTGATDLSEAVEAFNAGIIHGFLQKPWNKTQLMDLVRKELGIHDAAVREVTTRAQLEQQSKLRGERLIHTIKELKQAQTQLVLLEDGSSTEALKAGQSLRGLSFLVVDENEGVRNLLLGALNGAGIAKCHGEPSAAAALEYLRRSDRVDVILAEWSMKGTDGIAFFRQVREAPTHSKEALFILMAAHEQRELVDFAKKSGINDYLLKPFRLATLFGSIEKMLPQIAARKAEVAANLAEATVLVVNTHPASRDQIEQLLVQAGVKNVLSATFGPAAMTLLEEKKPALVIYDTNVTGPDWADLKDRFRQNPGAPALVITGVFPTQADWDRMRELGESNFLPGPFRQEDLLQAITNVWKLPCV